MSDAVFGGLVAAGILIPVFVSLVSLAFARSNEGKKLTPYQSCLFGLLWVLGTIGFGVMIAVGEERYQDKEAMAGYGVIGGMVLLASLVLLAHAMFNFDD